MQSHAHKEDWCLGTGYRNNLSLIHHHNSKYTPLTCPADNRWIASHSCERWPQQGLEKVQKQTSNSSNAGFWTILEQGLLMTRRHWCWGSRRESQFQGDWDKGRIRYHSLTPSQKVPTICNLVPASWTLMGPLHIPLIWPSVFPPHPWPHTDGHLLLSWLAPCISLPGLP